MGEDPLDEALAYEQHTTTNTPTDNNNARRRHLLTNAHIEEGEITQSTTHKTQARGFLHGVDLSRHFSYYAFEGGSGGHRWTHEVIVVVDLLLLIP